MAIEERKELKSHSHIENNNHQDKSINNEDEPSMNITISIKGLHPQHITNKM